MSQTVRSSCNLTVALPAGALVSEDVGAASSGGRADTAASSNIPPQCHFRPERFEALFIREDRHFWFEARNRCIAAAATLISDLTSIKDVIEHGCGTGFVLRRLQRIFPEARVTGADLFAEGLAFARKRFAGNLVQVDVMNSLYRECFDLVGFFDVLEHLDDDLAALRVLRSQLRPGGWLLLTVPAHMWLWTEHDLAAQHRRRYTRRQLTTVLSEAGFKLRYCTEFMLPLVPLMWVRRLLSRMRSVSKESTECEVKSHLRVHPLINRVMGLLLAPESACIARGWRLPVGASIIALARRELS